MRARAPRRDLNASGGGRRASADLLSNGRNRYGEAVEVSRNLLIYEVAIWTVIGGAILLLRRELRNRYEEASTA